MAEDKKSNEPDYSDLEGDAAGDKKEKAIKDTVQGAVEKIQDLVAGTVVPPGMIKDEKKPKED